MSRDAQSQGDLTKVAQAMVKTMVKVGITGWRMEMEPGKIILVAGDADKASPSAPAPAEDDLDRELAEFEARHGQV